jgi:hypothetical protein
MTRAILTAVRGLKHVFKGKSYALETLADPPEVNFGIGIGSKVC